MAIEDLLAESFNRIINGETINEKIGDWSVSNLNSPRNLKVIYDKCLANYGFHISIGDNFIHLLNYHRDAEKGYGTMTLKQIESALNVLANKRKQQIVIGFELFNQEDTEAWLNKNEYTKIREGYYQKVIKPELHESKNRR